MVTIIDYGIGNLRSIEKAFQHVDVAVRRTDDPEAIRSADRLVLPGVGAFGACIGEVRSRDLGDPIRAAIDAGTPFLGVCVGLQLLFEVGEERGEHPGLGVLPGRVVRFDREELEAASGETLKIPHMGWNTVRFSRPHPLLAEIPDESYFYFVHSFFVRPEREEDVLGWTEYGVPFPAMVGRENVLGVQFHPEKSQTHGLRILRNFAALTPEPAQAA